jgi:hypothetical protein
MLCWLVQMLEQSRVLSSMAATSALPSNWWTIFLTSRPQQSSWVSRYRYRYRYSNMAAIFASVAEPEPVEQQLFAGAGHVNSYKMLQKP